MKSIVKLLAICLLLITSIACQSKAPQKSIEIKEMRELTQLATVDCYFHNVAKSNKETNPAWYEVWKKKNMKFWVEYDGVVQLGIDASKLKVDISEDDVVKIYIPEVEVIDAYVDNTSLTDESFYFDPNSEMPSPEEQSEAFNQAQEAMKMVAESNNSLKLNARENAKELLKNYVNSVGEALGKEYTIEWEYLEDETIVQESEPEGDSEEVEEEGKTDQD